MQHMGTSHVQNNDAGVMDRIVVDVVQTSLEKGNLLVRGFESSRIINDSRFVVVVVFNLNKPNVTFTRVVFCRKGESNFLKLFLHKIILIINTVAFFVSFGLFH